MIFKWEQPLKKFMRENPVVHSQIVTFADDFFYPTDEQLEQIFPTGKNQLKTWGRDGDLENSPHWIGTRGGTPLHTDPRYPRYTHQLKIRVDAGVSCRGKNKQEIQLVRGLFYILDTHSPHQILNAEDKLAYNVSVSIDSKTVLNPAICIPRCIQYVQTHPFLSEIYK